MTDTKKEIRHAIHCAAKIAGDFVEFGVLSGTTAVVMLRGAVEQGKRYHGVDSFLGMGQPGPHDYDEDGACPYPAGRFAHGTQTARMGGVHERLRKEVREATTKSFRLWPGYVPEVLGGIDVPQFSLTYADLDHYQPTLDALRWVWPRLSIGGVVLCHDVYQDKDNLASKAVKEFITETGSALEIVTEYPDQILFRKVRNAEDAVKE